MLPKSLRVTLRLSDNALAIPKSRTLIDPSVCDPDVPRLQIAVDERHEFAAVDVTLESVSGLRRSGSTPARFWCASAGFTGPRAITSDRFSPSTYSIAMK